jgi:hypothetical protein
MTLLTLAGLLVLGGCTVESGSRVGLSVDAEGRPVAVVAVCKGYLDGLTIYSGHGSDEHDDAKWQHIGRLQADATLTLEEPGDDWKVVRPMELKPRQSYSIYGWTKANRWSAQGPDFNEADLRRLRAGQVWYESNDGGFQNVFTSAAEFHTIACSDQ